MLKKTKAVPSTNATIAICANVTLVDRERDDEAADRGDANGVGGEHQHAPVPAVDRDAGEEREEGVGEDAREADDAGAATGECVSARTSSGYAICVACVPAVEKSCPTWRRTKSRFRRSGEARQAASAGSTSAVVSSGRRVSR